MYYILFTQIFRFVSNSTWSSSSPDATFSSGSTFALAFLLSRIYLQKPFQLYDILCQTQIHSGFGLTRLLPPRLDNVPHRLHVLVFTFLMLPFCVSEFCLLVILPVWRKTCCYCSCSFRLLNNYQKI